MDGQELGEVTYGRSSPRDSPVPRATGVSAPDKRCRWSRWSALFGAGFFAVTFVKVDNVPQPGKPWQCTGHNARHVQLRERPFGIGLR